MKAPLRFQSQLLVRRSYKPARVKRRAIGIAFQPARPVVVSISTTQTNVTPASAPSVDVTLSG